MILKKSFTGLSGLNANHFFLSKNDREINEIIEKKSKKMAKFDW